MMVLATEDVFVWPSRREVEILRFLRGASRGMCGFEIVDRSDGGIGRSSVYVLLARLKRKGFVRIRRRSCKHPGRPRPIYAITRSGQRAVAAFELATMGEAKHVPGSD